MKCNRKHDRLVRSQIIVDRGEGENEYECEKPVPKGATEQVFHGKVPKREISDSGKLCSNTHQNQKYVTRKIRSSISLVPQRRGGKEVVYDGYVKAALVKIWEIFDYPGGQ